MYIKTSKIFTKWMRGSVKLDCIESIELVTLNGSAYELTTGETAGYLSSDRNDGTGLYNVIKINYTWDCYALPRYLTTRELNNIYKRCTEKTADGFIYALKNAIEI